MPKYTVSLTEELAESFKAQGGGNLSRGMDNLYRDWKRGITPVGIVGAGSGPTKRTTATPEPELPIDPRNPSKHQGTANRLAREDREAEEKKALDWRNHRVTMHWEIEQCGDLSRLSSDYYNGDYFAGMPDAWRDLDFVFTPEELAQAYADHRAHVGRMRASNLQADIDTAETKRLRDSGLPDTRVLKPVQTTKLTVVAMRRLGLFGTPEGLTDAQIAELNEGYKDDAPTDGIGEEIYEKYNPNADNE